MADKELMQEALKWQEHIKVLANEYAENELYQKRNKVLDWLLDQAEKAEKYREALEFYADENSYRKIGFAELYSPAEKDFGQKARQALEGEGNA